MSDCGRRSAGRNPIPNVYHGWLDDRGICHVEVDDGQGDRRPLRDRGFEWGVSGAELPELAAALLHDALGNNNAEPRRFVLDVLALLPAGRWTLTQAQIAEWAQGHPRQNSV
jgi:uncharacterized protein DUF6166